jgi:hypothetical protein
MRPTATAAAAGDLAAAALLCAAVILAPAPAASATLASARTVLLFEIIVAIGWMFLLDERRDGGRVWLTFACLAAPALLALFLAKEIDALTGLGYLGCLAYRAFVANSRDPELSVRARHARIDAVAAGVVMLGYAVLSDLRVATPSTAALVCAGWFTYRGFAHFLRASNPSLGVPAPREEPT